MWEIINLCVQHCRDDNYKKLLSLITSLSSFHCLLKGKKLTSASDQINCIHTNTIVNVSLLILLMSVLSCFVMNFKIIGMDKYCMIQILKGENLGKMAHSRNWQIIFWRMPKITKHLIFMHNMKSHVYHIFTCSTFHRVTSVQRTNLLRNSKFVVTWR